MGGVTICAVGGGGAGIWGGCGKRGSPAGTAPISEASIVRRAAGMLVVSNPGGGSGRSLAELTVLCAYPAIRCGGSFDLGARLAVTEAILL